MGGKICSRTLAPYRARPRSARGRRDTDWAEPARSTRYARANGGLCCRGTQPRDHKRTEQTLANAPAAPSWLPHLERAFQLCVWPTIVVGFGRRQFAQLLWAGMPRCHGLPSLHRLPTIPVSVQCQRQPSR